MIRFFGLLYTFTVANVASAVDYLLPPWQRNVAAAGIPLRAPKSKINLKDTPLAGHVVGGGAAVFKASDIAALRKSATPINGAPDHEQEPPKIVKSDPIKAATLQGVLKHVVESKEDGDHRLNKAVDVKWSKGLPAGNKKEASEQASAFKNDPVKAATLEEVPFGDNIPEASGDHIRGHRKVFTWDMSFLANVIGPVDLKALLGPVDHDHSRRLQAQCFELDDGSIACVLDDAPGDGLITIFFGCPRSSSFPLTDCAACVIVLTESPSTLDPNDPQCTSCTVCSDTIAWDCRNIISGDCARATCSGCVSDTPPTPPPVSPTSPPVSPTHPPVTPTAPPVTATPPPTETRSDPTPAPEDTVECFDTTDGPPGTDWICVVDDLPVEGFVIVYWCPDTAQTTLDCMDCDIVFTESPDTLSNGDPVCTSCTICTDRVAWECSNLVPGAECANVDCSGTCFTDPTPPPTPPPVNPTPPPVNPTPFPTVLPPPTPPPTTTRADPTPAPEDTVDCLDTTDGPPGTDWVCFADDSPAEGFVIVYWCPDTAQTTSDCIDCDIYLTENPDTISASDPVCMDCSICPVAERIAWQCSNVASGECSDIDCDGVCFGDDDPVPPPTPPPTMIAPPPTTQVTPSPTSPRQPTGPLFPTPPPVDTSGAAVIKKSLLSVLLMGVAWATMM